MTAAQVAATAIATVTIAAALIGLGFRAAERIHGRFNDELSGGIE